MFKIKSGRGFKLAKIPTVVKPLYRSEDDYKEQLDQIHEQLGEYQTKLYASGSRSMLVVFQGMDTSGKDGAIKHVVSGVNPQGCSVFSFKTPTRDDLQHDFLWRVNRALPARGQIGIFNRSYYEEALITHVHPKLLQAEKLPSGPENDKKFWTNRYRDINHHEKYLVHQGYEVVKIFLHISRLEQKERLLDRFNNPKKNWKVSEGDIIERKFWKEYQIAYDECIRNTSTKSAPWYVVPADDKFNARLMVSEILLSRFSKMRLHYPKLNLADKKKLKKWKTQLEGMP